MEVARDIIWHRQDEGGGWLTTPNQIQKNGFGHLTLFSSLLLSFSVFRCFVLLCASCVLLLNVVVI